MCASCPFCSTTSCGGHGTCDAAASTCVCDSGYSGTLCQASSACAGPLDRTLTCCPAGSVLDVNDACCEGVLDAAGACCGAGSAINACGACVAHSVVGVAVVSVTGQCCSNGVADAGGVCCASGAVDVYGVCDGNDASGSQVVTATATLSPSFNHTQDDFDDPLSSTRLQFDSDFAAFVAGRLRRNASDVQVTSVHVTSVAHRALSAPYARRQLVSGGSVVVTTTLAPYGGSNNLPASTLSSLLSSTATSTDNSTLFVVASVASDHASAVCNNGVCEVGERPDSVTGVTGCPQDCPVPVLHCPASPSSGLTCNGVGSCVVTTSGSAVCACSAAQGYAGADCGSCAIGYTAVAGSGCVRLVASQVIAPPSSSGLTRTDVGLIIGFSIGGGLLLLFGAVYIFRSLASPRKRTDTVGPYHADHPGDTTVTVALDGTVTRTVAAPLAAATAGSMLSTSGVLATTESPL